MRRVIVSFLLLVSFVSNAQLPYLNASTGNAGEFPVDKDTNIYMFHGNRLVKTDKNFNVIWAKTYSNISFSNILLSKTGSLFFIGGNIVGKLENNGNISWAKDLQAISTTSINNSSFNFNTASVNSILLDHNNNLVITGNTTLNSNGNYYYLKTDTNGNGIKLNIFKHLLVDINFSINRDSLGLYQFIVGGPTTVGPSNGIYRFFFDDNSNATVEMKPTFDAGGNSNMNWRYIRSKFANEFYVLSPDMPYPSNFGGRCVGLVKFMNTGSVKWFSKQVGLPSTPANYAFGRTMIEDAQKNIFIQMTTGNYTVNYNSALFKLDSTGLLNNQGLNVLSIYNSSSSEYNFTSHAPQTIYANKHYIDIVSSDFPDNPLTLKTFNNSLTSICSISTTCSQTLQSGPTPNFFATSAPTIAAITSFTLNTYNASVNNATLMINSNNCTLQTDKEIRIANQDFSLHPNPTSNILKFDLGNSAEVEEVNVIDVNGKIIKTYFDSKEISVSDLAPGIYFLQLKSDGQLYYSKFIKE